MGLQTFGVTLAVWLGIGLLLPLLIGATLLLLALGKAAKRGDAAYSEARWNEFMQKGDESEVA